LREKLKKMANAQFRAIDIFENKLCGVCGTEDISQYHSISDNYIEYCGIYVSLREILKESLDIEVTCPFAVLIRVNNTTVRF
jgi:hypothetical protein